MESTGEKREKTNKSQQEQDGIHVREGEGGQRNGEDGRRRGGEGG